MKICLVPERQTAIKIAFFVSKNVYFFISILEYTLDNF